MSNTQLQTTDPILLDERIQNCAVDFDNLIQALESLLIQESSSAIMVGLLKRLVNPLRQRLDEIKKLAARGDNTQAWELLGAIQRQSGHVMERAQSFLGGVAIRRAGLDEGMANSALQMVQSFSERTGINWSPALAFSATDMDDWEEGLLVAKDAQDNLVQMRIPHWDIWHLPLVAHHYAYSVVKRGEIQDFQTFVAGQIKLVESLVDNESLSADKFVPFLPEIRAAQQRREATDQASFKEQMAGLIKTYCARQTIHLWRLIADAFATYLIGPAYAYALIFLSLDPSQPLIEGEAQSDRNGRSRLAPSAARRAATVLYTLQRMNDEKKSDYAEGPFSAELRLLTAVWERSLGLFGFLDQYRAVNAGMTDWLERIYGALETEFSLMLEQTVDLWEESVTQVVPVFQNGNDDATKVSLDKLMCAAWWCRPRYPDRIAGLSNDCARLLAGNSTVGLLASQAQVKDESSRLISSKLNDIETDVERIRKVFDSEAIQQSHRDAVAGRFYRLLSERDYSLRGLEKLVKKEASPVATLAEAMKQAEAEQTNALRRETLDFLGGVLMRQEKLDKGICSLAEALLSEYAQMTGVNWASRVVLGSNPLFSESSEIVHHRFPDWDIWNLPLMAHEFGHVIAPTTPELKTEINDQILIAAQGHPEAPDWTEEDLYAYRSKRAHHLDEFFADAFATYCQGPAFAYDVFLNHLNPVQAYLPRGNHPTHAERMEVILEVIRAMNREEKFDEHDNGPYDGVLNRLTAWWSKALEDAKGAEGPVEQFHRVKAKSLAFKLHALLSKFYRLGAQYQASEWTRAEAAARQLLEDEGNLEGESFRNLLNIAWICRLRQPRDVVRIGKLIRESIERTLASREIPSTPAVQEGL